MEIRLLTTADASEYWRLRLEALESEPESFTASVEEHRTMGIYGVAPRLEADPEERFVAGAFVEGELVGIAGFFRERGAKERHKGRIWGVYVTQSMRGKGAGRSVLQTLLGHAANCRGLEQITLIVNARAPARKLYGSLGFRSFGCEQRALKIGDRYVDEEYMVLDLLNPR